MCARASGDVMMLARQDVATDKKAGNVAAFLAQVRLSLSLSLKPLMSRAQDAVSPQVWGDGKP